MKQVANSWIDRIGRGAIMWLPNRVFLHPELIIQAVGYLGYEDDSNHLHGTAGDWEYHPAADPKFQGRLEPLSAMP
jgi:hypothetical protein